MAAYTSTVALINNRVTYFGEYESLDCFLQDFGLTDYGTAYGAFVTVTTSQTFSVLDLDAIITDMNLPMSGIEAIALNWQVLYPDFRAARVAMLALTPVGSWETNIYNIWQTGNVTYTQWFFNEMRKARIQRWNLCSALFFQTYPALGDQVVLFLKQQGIEDTYIETGAQSYDAISGTSYLLDFINSTNAYVANGLASYGVAPAMITDLANIITNGVA